MTEQELIAKQSLEIANLSEKLDNVILYTQKALIQIYGIGGPLNDNKLGYNKEQMITFYRIAELLEQI